MRWQGQLTARLALWAVALVVASTVPASGAEPSESLDGRIRMYLDARGTYVQMAPEHQLARRYAIDLTGAVPSPADLIAIRGRTPAQMFDYFVAKGPTGYSGEERPYVWVNLLYDADHFLFSNNIQFSQVAHIREFRDELAKVYREGRNYLEFARWALTSQMFLNRFPSAADRANASFFLFLGRDSLSSEVPFGNMWNGYRLKNRRVPGQESETHPDWHVYIYDEIRCTSGRVACKAELWSRSGSTPEDAVDLLLNSPLFAEALVDRYWQRLIKTPFPGVDFPELRQMLAADLVAREYDVNWLIREIATSAAYTQEAMFR